MMGRAERINNTHYRIAVNRGHGRMQHALLITATPDKLGCNSMNSELSALQELGSIMVNILRKTVSYG